MLQNTRLTVQFMTSILCLMVLCSSIAVAQTRSPLGQEYSVQGITEPYQQSMISATVAGKLEKIHKKEGTLVKKGESILHLEKTEEELETRRRKLIADNKAEVTAAKHQRSVLKKDYDATQELYKVTQSVSEEEVWQKELEYKRAEAEYQRLKVAEKREQMEYNIALAQMQKREIRAPFSGVVVKINRSLGESINALEPLVQLVNVQKCRFIAYVEAGWVRDLGPGDTVALQIDGGSAVGSTNRKDPITIRGSVEFVSPVVDPSSGLRKVKVVFDNQDRKVQPGISGRMLLPPLSKGKGDVQATHTRGHSITREDV